MTARLSTDTTVALDPLGTFSIIEPADDLNSPKTRTFSASLLALVVADEQWDPGAAPNDRTLRPALLAYAATDLASRAFTANLRAGRTARETAPDDRNRNRLRLALPRNAVFRYDTHTVDGTTLTLAYQPFVFALDPNPQDDPRTVRFVAMPTTWWIDREAQILSELGSDAREAALAAYFVAYLDRHAPFPIANDPRFHLALYRAAREAPWCHAPSLDPHETTHLYARGHAALGFENPLAVATDWDELADFLADVTAKNLSIHPS
jgi:hypothetical protein